MRVRSEKEGKLNQHAAALRLTDQPLRSNKNWTAWLTASDGSGRAGGWLPQVGWMHRLSRRTACPACMLLLRNHPRLCTS